MGGWAGTWPPAPRQAGRLGGHGLNGLWQVMWGTTPGKHKIARSDKCGDYAACFWCSPPSSPPILPPSRYHPASTTHAAISLGYQLQPQSSTTGHGCTPQPRPRTRLHGYENGFHGPLLPRARPRSLSCPSTLCSFSKTVALQALKLWNDRVRLAYFDHPIVHPIPHTGLHAPFRTYLTYLTSFLPFDLPSPRPLLDLDLDIPIPYPDWAILGRCPYRPAILRVLR